MSGGLVTNLFLEDYASQHRDALRAKAAAEGRTLSVENPEAKRFQKQQAQPTTNSTNTVTAADEKKQSSGWWSRLQNKTSPKDKAPDVDVKSLNSFSSGESY